MHIKKSTVKTKTGKKEYLNIVKSYRDKGKGKIKHKTILSLGRADKINDREIQEIIFGLSKLTENLQIMSGEVKDPDVQIHKTKNLGIPLVIDHFWKKLNMSILLESIQKKYPKLEFDLELVFRSAIIYRLIKPGSERAMIDWFADIDIQGVEKLKIHHLYRGLMIISEHREEIENHLIENQKTLFGIDLSLVFFDTTTTYFEGDSIDNEAIKQYGHSKDHRPDRKQIKIGMVMSRDGLPIHLPIFAGDESDVSTIPNIIDNLKNKKLNDININKLIFVGDSGMTSKKNIEELENNNMGYILGSKMRNTKAIKEEIIISPYIDLLKDNKNNHIYKIKKNLFAIEKTINQKKYVICFNPEEAKKDKAVRGKIITELELSSNQSIKKYIKHKLKKRFISSDKSKITINRKKIKQEEKFDGLFVIETNTDLSKEEVVMRYKDLILVENAFRHLKSTLSIRPVYHKTTENIEGHVFISFMSLVFFCLILKKLQKKGSLPCEQNQIINSLSRITSHETVICNKKFILRSEINTTNRQILSSLGIKTPNQVIKNDW